MIYNVTLIRGSGPAGGGVKRSVLVLIVALFAVSGCQTSSQLTAAVSDEEGVSCGEIRQAFQAYERDRQSAQALKELSLMLSPSAGAYAAEGIESAEGYYEQIRISTNLALATRGCDPVR